jgi:hypothetical protein
MTCQIDSSDYKTAEKNEMDGQNLQTKLERGTRSCLVS